MSTATTTLAEDAASAADLKRQATVAQSTADDLKLLAKDAEQHLFERMESDGVGSLRLEGIGNFVRAETVYGQVQDRAEFIKWAGENAPELLETKERKKLVNELVRERLDSGELLPDGLGFYTMRYVSVRA